MNIKQFLPIFDWLSQYDKNFFKNDLIAGLTVGVMLIPQGMAYAMLAGLPPVYGLYSATIPLIIYAVFGTSRQLAVGPSAMVSLLTLTAVGTLATVGSGEFIQFAIGMALLVGVIKLLMGIFRLGFLVNFLSHPVLSGFTSAAALIIGLSQLKHLLGINIPRTHHINEIIVKAFEKAGEINPYTLGIGIAGIIMILVLKKYKSKIPFPLPGPLVAVIFGIVIVKILHLEAYGVKVVGKVPSDLPAFSIPEISLANLKIMLPMALTIALVSVMESIAVAKSIQSKHGDYKVVPRQELLGLGFANIVGSFFQSFPITGGFGRTAVNDQSGAKTPMAGVISALFILFSLLVLTPYFKTLPKAILGSVIMVAVASLIDIKEVKFLWKANKTDFFMLVATFIGTLTLGIEQGIGLGVVLSLAMVIFKTTYPHVAILGQVPGTHFYRNVNRFENVSERDDLLIVRFDAQLYFANVSFFKDKIEELINEKGDKLRAVIINGDSMNNLDSSAVHALKDVLKDIRKKGLHLVFTGIKGPVRDAMIKADFMEEVGEKYFFMSIQEAVDCVDDVCISKPAQFQEYLQQAND